MSLIGTLEQINLANLLQRLESYSKSGLLIVKQGMQWVELYFRDGRLMCIGPVRTNATLGSRLLQEGLISPHALQEVLQFLGGAETSETRIALTLMDMGYITHEQLRIWAMKKASEVLQVLLTWGDGEVHFEENYAPPEERLLVAIVSSTLLSAIVGSQSQPAIQANSLQQPGWVEQPRVEPLQPQLTRASEIPNAPTLMDASQFGIETSSSYNYDYGFAENQRPDFSMQAAAMKPAIFTEPAALVGEESFVSVLSGAGNEVEDDRAFVSFLEDGGGKEGFGSTSGRRQPEAVRTPMVPKRIDISFMRPEMILLPVDFSAAQVQNPSVQITPEQWMIFAQVDGQNSLQRICMNLGSQPAQVCIVVGELLAEGLIQLCMPDALPMQELSPLSRDVVTAGMNNGYIAPGYAEMAVPPWSPSMAVPDVMPGYGNSGFEAQSQWGNGANGANFVPGQGWIATQQPLQPLQASGPLGRYPNAYAPAGGNFS